MVSLSLSFKQEVYPSTSPVSGQKNFLSKALPTNSVTLEIYNIKTLSPKYLDYRCLPLHLAQLKNQEIQIMMQDTVRIAIVPCSVLVDRKWLALSVDTLRCHWTALWKMAQSISRKKLFQDYHPWKGPSKGSRWTIQKVENIIWA